MFPNETEEKNVRSLLTELHLNFPNLMIIVCQALQQQVSTDVAIWVQT